MLYLLMLGLPYVLFGKRWICGACGNRWRRSIYEESDDEDEGDEKGARARDRADEEDEDGFEDETGAPPEKRGRQP
jgi:hypothetical protein